MALPAKHHEISRTFAPDKSAKVTKLYVKPFNKRSMSLKLKLVQNNNDQTAAYGKYFPRVDYGKIIDIEGLAAHIHAHHAIYPEDLVEGVLKCAARCTKELMLEGYPVKWDGVAIFKAGLDNKGGFSNIKDAVLTIGEKGSTIQAIKLTAQATGTFTKSELTDNGELEWNSEWRRKIAEEKKKEQGDTTSNNTPPTGNDNTGEGPVNSDTGDGPTNP